MKADDVYWDKPDLPDDLRAMANIHLRGMENVLLHAMVHSAARRIEHLEAQTSPRRGSE